MKVKKQKIVIIVGNELDEINQYLNEGWFVDTESITANKNVYGGSVFLVVIYKYVDQDQLDLSK